MSQPELGVPATTVEEARAVCARVWPDRPTALEQVMELRRLGWHVPLSDPSYGPAVATVLHPQGAVVGHVRCAR